MATTKKLLVTIIQRGHVKAMLRALPEALEHGTIVLKGRGTINPDLFESLVGLTYDDARDVVLTLLDAGDVKAVQDVFMRVGRMDDKNTGIMFVIDGDRALGIVSRFDYL